MKKLSITTIGFLILSLALSVSAESRTWTSADGSKTFEGELRSYNPDSKQVEVITGGRRLTFSADVLSEADQTYLAEQEASKPMDPDAIEEALKASEVGALIAKTKLSKLDGSRFRRTELDVVPEYYFLYYSASW
ncbi:MAG: hypothetical protein AAF236_15570 [Verrucomicrobiota bacterium]